MKEQKTMKSISFVYQIPLVGSVIVCGTKTTRIND